MKAVVGTKEPIHFNHTDTGLFGTIFEVWSKHLNLRTCPEDWWLPVITRVATLVDNNANKDSVKKYFVGDQPGKVDIEVKVDSFNIYETDYTFVFKSISKQIKEKISVPGYVETMSSSFSTTTPEQLIGSQITIMKSVQKYFNYKMCVEGCGIKALEMSGTENDWRLLNEKLIKLRKLLAPIESTLKISDFFNQVETVYTNLLKTYLGENMEDWWSKVLMDCEGFRYGTSGMRRKVSAYNGWLVFFCTGENSPLLAAKLAQGKCKKLSCLSSCKMDIIDSVNHINDESTLMTGILGFKINRNSHPNGVASLQPAHGWAMLFHEGSQFIKKNENSIK
jgi:hypothetical protein